MLKIITVLPAILVALIITVITSLYINSRTQVAELHDSITFLRNEIKDVRTQLDQSQEKIKKLEQRALFSEQQETLTGAPVESNPIESKTTPPVVGRVDEPAVAEEPTPISEEALNNVATKVNSIAKFIPLNDDQKRRLSEKFVSELDKANPPAESLDDIIGKENADFYREQRKVAFERVLKESIEKEIIFISRKLSLLPAQEELFRKTYFEIEDEIRKSRENPDTKQSSTNTLERLVLEEKERNRLLAERMKLVLDASQYQDFLKHQSGSQDMQLWHER